MDFRFRSSLIFSTLILMFFSSSTNASETLPLRFVLLGDSSVGKTSFIQRYTRGVFSMSTLATVGVDFAFQTVSVDGQEVRVQIWDTAGIERFHSITTSYLRRVDGVLLFYDITDRHSFEQLRVRWIGTLRRSGLLDSMDGVGIVLVGNKVDLETERRVSLEEGEALAYELGVNHMEVSAKVGSNIEQVMKVLVKLVLPMRRSRSLEIYNVSPAEKSPGCFRGCF